MSGAGRPRGRRGGTVGGWASVFARPSGARRVVVVERGLAGMGASSRAAGIVRAQGGTPATVALGRWSIDFYNGQQAAYRTDSGFRELGYVILAVTDEDERAGRERVAMQQRGRPRRPVARRRRGRRDAVTLAPRAIAAGATSRPTAQIDPPRNVRAYSLAMQAAGVELRERTRSPALRTEPRVAGTRVVAVETDAGTIETERVLLTGGPSLRAVGRLAGLRIPAGAARHTVAVLEPHAAFDVDAPCRWSSTSVPGCTGGSRRAGSSSAGATRTRRPGEARAIDWAFYERDAGAARRVRAA